MNRNTAIGWALAILLAGVPAIGWAEDISPAAEESKAPEVQPEAETAVPASEMQVVEASVATGIENRAPQGAAESFPAGTEKLYCYTKLAGGQAWDEITHKWMKGGEQRAVVILKVGGSPWRTFSSKTILKEDTGAWSVEILQGDTVLKTVSFEIK